MPEPSFYSDGFTPRVTDPLLVVMKKQLGAAIAAVGDTTPSSAPALNDTQSMTEEKLNKVLNNVA